MARKAFLGEGTNADELVHRKHQLQGSTILTVRNIITSMRLVSDVDWASIFEAVSPVDDVLRTAGVRALAVTSSMPRSTVPPRYRCMVKRGFGRARTARHTRSS